MNRILRGISNLAWDLFRVFVLAFIVVSAFISVVAMVAGGSI